ncbi:uncharacterized protein JCM6883_006709 [Sporobolomyces salmoneus]|uniref:uncharacterized protein n=1 Tax=Sporobolomyces salmoneus TaxID=183962 RepID=UPI0031799B97
MSGQYDHTKRLIKAKVYLRTPTPTPSPDETAAQPPLLTPARLDSELQKVSEHGQAAGQASGSHERAESTTKELPYSHEEFMRATPEKTRAEGKGRSGTVFPALDTFEAVHNALLDFELKDQQAGGQVVKMGKKALQHAARERMLTRERERNTRRMLGELGRLNSLMEAGISEEEEGGVGTAEEKRAGVKAEEEDQDLIDSFSLLPPEMQEKIKEEALDELLKIVGSVTSKELDGILKTSTEPAAYEVRLINNLLEKGNSAAKNE